MRRTSIRRTAGLACLLSCLTFTMAKADVTANFSDILNWNYAVTHMSDFDQRRQAYPALNILGLPGDGHAYCVPTSCYNLLQYAHAHGYPLVQAVDDYNGWTTTTYNQATQDLWSLGFIMGTDPDKGTGGGEAFLERVMNFRPIP